MADTFSQRFVYFSKRSTFHGFREFAESRRWFQKFVWFSIMLASLGMLVFALQKQVRQYLSGPTMTRVVQLDDGEPYPYPSVWFVVNNWTWLDIEKIEKHQITYEELQYARGFIYWNVSLESSMDLEEVRKKFENSMKRMKVRNVDHFFAELILTDFGPPTESTWDVHSKSFNPQTCVYLLDMNESCAPDYSQTLRLKLTFDFSRYYENAERLYNFFREPSPIVRDASTGLWRSIPDFHPPSLFNADTSQSVDLESDTHLTMVIDAKVYRKLRNCNKDKTAEENPLYYTSLCKLDCEVGTNSTFGQSCIEVDQRLSFTIYSTSSIVRGTSRSCHNGLVVNGSLQGVEKPILGNTSLKERESAFWQCAKKCLRKCTHINTIWDTKVSLLSNSPAAIETGTTVAPLANPQTYSHSRNQSQSLKTEITIDFPDRWMLVIFQEEQQYDWSDMVSDLGGLLGLWLGASMMSLFQMVHLCCKGRSGKPEFILPLRLEQKKRAG